MTMTREQWLNEVVASLRPRFAEIGFPLPEKLRASCGWPSSGGLGKKKRVIGQCWYPEASNDKTTEVFISPTQSNAGPVVETLAHELGHAAVGHGHGHRGKFIQVARALGFTAPWTRTPATPELADYLLDLCKPLGLYPHATLEGLVLEGGKKPQKARQMKCECVDCGYVARTTRKWLTERGAPICPCNNKPMGTDLAGDEDDDPGDEREEVTCPSCGRTLAYFAGPGKGERGRICLTPGCDLSEVELEAA